MSTVDTSTWNPDADLNVEIEGIPLNADAGIAQTWQVIRALMAALKGDTGALQTQIDGKLKRGSYERIEGNSSSHKDLNDYVDAGFYNVKTVHVDNCPSGIGIDAVLLVYPWNSSSYLTQEITESAASGDVRRWLRKLNGTDWSAWKPVAVGTITSAQIAALFENDGIDPDDPPVAHPERAVLCGDGMWRYLEQIAFPVGS